LGGKKFNIRGAKSNKLTSWNIDKDLIEGNASFTWQVLTLKSFNLILMLIVFEDNLA
jgi:hypothetical protein